MFNQKIYIHTHFKSVLSEKHVSLMIKQNKIFNNLYFFKNYDLFIYFYKPFIYIYFFKSIIDLMSELPFIEDFWYDN